MKSGFRSTIFKLLTMKKLQIIRDQEIPRIPSIKEWIVPSPNLN